MFKKIFEYAGPYKMIPDIVQDTSKVDDILFGKCESLLEFAEILKGVTLDIEEIQK